MEKVRFQSLIDTLSSVATLGKWETLYNKQLDFFYWKKPKLSKDVQLVKVSHETHLYLNRSGKIEGILVEYLNNNFAAHNIGYKDIVKVFTKKIDENKYTIANKSKKMEAIFDKFAESIRADIYRDAIDDKKTVDDLNFVIAQVVKG